MPEQLHYLDEKGQPKGPASTEEIQKLAQAAKQSGRPLLVAKPGDNNWLPFPGTEVPNPLPSAAPVRRPHPAANAPRPQQQPQPQPVQQPQPLQQPQQPAPQQQPAPLQQQQQPQQLQQPQPIAQASGPIAPPLQQQPFAAPPRAQPPPLAYHPQMPAQGFAHAPMQSYAPLPPVTTPWVAVACYILAAILVLGFLASLVLMIIGLSQDKGGSLKGFAEKTAIFLVPGSVIVSLFFVWAGKAVSLLNEIAVNSSRR